MGANTSRIVLKIIIVKHAHYCTVVISVNGDVKWGNVHHKTQWTK